jgi:hypothetical protein
MQPLERTKYQYRVVSGISHLAEEDWTVCYPTHAEGWHYYQACECAIVPGIRTAAIEVCDEKGLAAAVPIFELAYRLDTPLQGFLKRMSNAVARKFPKLAEWRLLGVGSPYADQCHIALRPDLSDDDRNNAITALIKAVEAEARRCGAVIIAYKDVLAAEYQVAEKMLTEARYATIKSLPMAVLDLDTSTLDGYLATLSAATRKDIRRKLRRADVVRIERTSDIGSVANAIDDLYQSTRLQSGVHYDAFEELPAGYFRAVSEGLTDKVMFILYWIEGELAAFNMLLLEPDRIIDKFLGMRYPLSRDYNLYVVSWMENIRLCLETGRRRLQSGQTGYSSKLRLGSRLVPSSLFVKHLNPLINRVVRWVAPIAAFDRWDPDLRQLAAEARS